MPAGAAPRHPTLPRLRVSHGRIARARQRNDAGCTQPAHKASMSAPSASPIAADTSSCASTMVR
eukprot:3192953-Pleurochrysis_carterae.AAC.1